MEAFRGPLEDLWKMPDLPNLNHLTWDWWWWLVMWPHESIAGVSKQLMVLWSTKETPAISVNGHPWSIAARPNEEEEGLTVLPGMVAGWYFDGQRMCEPLVLTEQRIVAIGPQHRSDMAAGAVITLGDQRLSTGLSAEAKRFWMRIQSDPSAVAQGAPKNFDISMSPWNEAVSRARRTYQRYPSDLGYDILRIHGAKAAIEVDGERAQGSAYLQKVRVQAPSIPWYWGMLHFSDGSYLDWFIPHLSPLAFSSSDEPWQLLDGIELPLRTSGLFHDIGRGRSENFAKVRLKKKRGRFAARDRAGREEDLPRFEIEMWNGRTMVVLSAEATSRAHWSFDQPTRGGMLSHFCYNEYPLLISAIAIEDEGGIRTLSDWEWVHGNAEHSWGMLH